MIAKGAHPAVAVPIVSQKTGEELICQFGFSGQKQTPQVAVCFEIIAGPHSGDRITWIGYFTDTVQKNGKTVSDRTLESLRVCGFTGNDLDRFNDQHPDREVHIVVDHETNPKDGQTYAKVAWVNDPSRAGGFVMENQMDGKQRRLFAAQFKSKLKSIPSVEGKKAERQPRSAAPADSGWSGNDQPDPPRPGEFDQSPPKGADDNDIPF